MVLRWHAHFAMHFYIEFFKLSASDPYTTSSQLMDRFQILASATDIRILVAFHSSLTSKVHGNFLFPGRQHSADRCLSAAECWARGSSESRFLQERSAEEESMHYISKETRVLQLIGKDIQITYSLN